MSQIEVEEAYEVNTEKVIVECVKERMVDPMAVPRIIIKNHGSFSWGKDAAESVYHAVVMETVAEMNLKTLILNSKAEMEQYVLDKHYRRKHGSNAYYGQEIYDRLNEK